MALEFLAHEDLDGTYLLFIACKGVCEQLNQKKPTLYANLAVKKQNSLNLISFFIWKDFKTDLKNISLKRRQTPCLCKKRLDQNLYSLGVELQKWKLLWNYFHTAIPAGVFNVKP